VEHAVKNDRLMRSNAPSLDLDPFSEEFLSSPYSYHGQLRDTGSVVWLSKYEIFAMARFSEVSESLKDWQTFCSGRGVGLTDFAKEKPWRPPSLLLETDPPFHEKTREIVGGTVTVSSLNALRPQWEVIADSLVEALVARRSFDAVTDLAEIYPLQVFPDAVGIRSDGRENLLPYGSLVFNAFGPQNWLTRQAMARSEPIMKWVAESCRRTNLSQGGFGVAIFAAADRGEITENEAERLVRSFLTAGLDTTVNGIANMIAAFATHPEQWQFLKDNPANARRAFDEVLRWDSTVQTFFRTTTREVSISGVTLPEGSKVILFLAAANHDPRRWDQPERFDLRRKVLAHVGFGEGIHRCIGQAVARIEAELILKALLKRVERIELSGEPCRKLNNTLHSWAKLPVRVTAVSG
jgi:4-methoxybenzoate monooxygenase (O-demethylating)